MDAEDGCDLATHVPSPDFAPRAQALRWMISNCTGLPTVLRSLQAPPGQPDRRGRCPGCGRRGRFLCVCDTVLTIDETVAS